MKKLAVLGPKGTFSDRAADIIVNNSKDKIKKYFYQSIDESFYALENECDAAIIPVENTLDGYVQRSLDLILEMNLHIKGEVFVPVSFSLVANTSSLEEIQNLYVQFKAKGQCNKVIKKLHNTKITKTNSNIESLNLAREGYEGDAAIIPRHAYNKDEFAFGIENVPDFPNNYTRFLLVEQNEDINEEFNDDIKVSLYIMDANNKPGVLMRILQVFYINNINIVAIMSRPTKECMGTYNFFIEVQADKSEKDNIFKTIDKINKSHIVKILGVYSNINSQNEKRINN